MTVPTPIPLPARNWSAGWRHLFYREEMADGVHESGEQHKRALDDPLEWYVYHARLRRFLAMDTFSKDLLEFGHNQGWPGGEGPATRREGFSDVP